MDDEEGATKNESTVERSNGKKGYRSPTIGNVMQHAQSEPASRDPSHARSAAATSWPEVQRLIVLLDRELSRDGVQSFASDGGDVTVETMSFPKAGTRTKTDQLRSAPTELDALRTTLQSAHGHLRTLKKELTAREDHDAHLEEVILTLREILVEREAQARQLTYDLIQAEQAERQRIAHILHEDLQQLLHALHMRMSMLTSGPPKGHAERLRQASKLVTRAVEVSRSLTVELSPPVLQKDDATEVVEWLGTRMKDLHSLNVEVQSPDTIHLPDELRILVYYCLRELLFNVVKHAHVDRAVVRLIQQKNELVVAVVDEGVGFDPASQAEQDPGPRGGFGLWSMNQRLNALGGRMERESTPGKGSCVRLFVPLPRPIIASSGKGEVDGREAAGVVRRATIGHSV